MNESTKRTLRTVFQTTVSVAGVLLVAVPAVLASAQDKVSPELYAKLAAVGAAIVAAAGAVTKVMHMPVVIGFLDTYAPWLSASVPVEDHVAEDGPDEPSANYPAVDLDATAEIAIVEG